MRRLGNCGWIIIGFVSGCANLSTVSRTTALPGDGVAIHLDAPQRLVYQSKNGPLCAEPTPDALQAYASALAAGGGISQQGALSLSNAYSANSQSVGLHTQSITLMRETLYRICEYSHNNNSDPLQVVQLLQRSQDLTLGVLAIEQLTGAVVARQAALVSGTNSFAAASINNTQAQLDAAQKNEEAKKAALAVAKDSESIEKSSMDGLQAQLDAEKAKEKPDADKMAELSKKISDQKVLLSDASTKVKTAQLNYDQSVAETKVIQSLLGTAMSSANASTSGAAQFSEGLSTKTIDSATAEHISKATVDIVKAVLSKGHMTDTCMAFLISHATPPTDARTQELIAQCSNVIKKSLELAAEGKPPAR